MRVGPEGLNRQNNPNDMICTRKKTEVILTVGIDSAKQVLLQFHRVKGGVDLHSIRRLKFL